MTLENTSVKILIQGKTIKSFKIGSGVKQKDAPLNYIKEIDPRGHIFIRSIQICAYADDIAILTWSTWGLRDSFKKLKSLSRKLRLKINENQIPGNNKNAKKTTRL